MSEPRLVELRTYGNEPEADIARAVLRDAGIESWTRPVDSASMGIFATTSFLPTRVMVLEQEHTEAVRVLEQNRQDSVELDWSEVDVGEAEDDLARRIAQGGYLDDAPPTPIAFDPFMLGGFALAVGLILLGAAPVGVPLLLVTSIYVFRRVLIRRKHRRLAEDAELFGR
ncbi:MAG: DUF2007 domain-containing protein [Planctomycetota bacterium]